MKRSEPFHLDMPFGEALSRFIATDPKETRAEIKRWNKQRQKDIAEASNVTTLKSVRERRRP